MVPDFKATRGLPQDSAGPVFNAPWEAAAFAMAVKLSEDGHFTWPEWVACYSGEIARREASVGHDETISYYEVWLSALEKMMAERGVVDASGLDARHKHLRDNPPPHSHHAHREPVCIA